MNASTSLIFTLPDSVRAITKRWKNSTSKRIIHSDGSLIFVNANSKWSLRFRNEKNITEYDSYDLARIAHAERAVNEH